MAAAGGLTYLGSIGILNYINCDGENFFDIIPADIVTNHVIVSTSYA
jgi:hypothetical protein